MSFEFAVWTIGFSVITIVLAYFVDNLRNRVKELERKDREKDG